MNHPQTRTPGQIPPDRCQTPLGQTSLDRCQTHLEIHPGCQTHLGRHLGRRATAVVGIFLGFVTLAVVPPAAAQGEACGPTKVLADSPAPGDLFGCAMALSEASWLAVGALERSGGRGSVSVYHRQGPQWLRVAEAGGPEVGAQFGFSVAFSGTTVVAGAPFAENGAGAAFAMDCSAAGCGAPRPLAIGTGAANLGLSVAADGATVAIGAPGHASSGAVFLVGLEGQPLAPPLVASDGAAGDGFGYSLALRGSVLLVGAPFAAGAVPASGKVYRFERLDGVWLARGTLEAPGLAAGDGFGWALALDGVQAVIGAPRHGAGGAAFRARGPAWNVSQLPDGGVDAGAQLGVSVAVDGDRALVGARFAGDGGRALLHSGSDLTVVEPLPGQGRAGDEVGLGVALDGALAVVGSYRDDSGGNDAGAVYSVVVEGIEISQAADLRLSKENLSPEPFVPGQTGLRFRYQVGNDGPCPAVDVKLSDNIALAPGSVVSVSPCAAAGVAPQCQREQGGLSCQLGDLPPSLEPACFEVTFDLDPDPAICDGLDAIDDLAVVHSATPDPDPDNNTASQAPACPPPSQSAALTLSKEGPAVAVPGTTVSYALRVANPAPVAAGGVVLDDPLPAGLTLVFASAPCAGGFPCALGSLEAGAERLVSATYRLAADACRAETAILNTASVTAAGRAPVQASASTVLVCDTDLALTFAAGAEAPCAGEATSHLLSATNLGSIDAFGATLKQSLPLELAAGGWSCACGLGTACRPASGTGELETQLDLAAGTTVTCSATATVGEEALGLVTTVASLDPAPGIGDPVAANNLATDRITLGTAELRLALAPATPTPCFAGTVAFDVAVANVGACPASELTVGVRSLAGLAAPRTADPCSPSGAFPCRLPDLAAGASTGFQAALAVSPSALFPGMIRFGVEASATGAVSGSVASVSQSLGCASPDLSLACMPAVTTEAVPVSCALTLANGGDCPLAGGVIESPGVAEFEHAIWACTASAGASCMPVSGPGVDDLVEVPVGGSLRYDLDAAIDPAACDGEIGVAVSLEDPAKRAGRREVAQTIRYLPTCATGSTGVPAPCIRGTLAVDGQLSPGGVLHNSLVLLNGGTGAQADRFGDELFLPLPPSLELLELEADRGTVTATTGQAGTGIRWNGSIPVGEQGRVAISIRARIRPELAVGTLVCSQGTIRFDGGPGGATLTRLTRDPRDPTCQDLATCFVVAPGSAHPIPALSLLGVVALILLLVAASWARLRSGV